MAKYEMESLDLSKLNQAKELAKGAVDYDAKSGQMTFTQDEKALDASLKAMANAQMLAVQTTSISKEMRYWNSGEIISQNKQAMKENQTSAKELAEQINPNGLNKENYGKYLDLSVSLNPTIKEKSLDEKLTNTILNQQIAEATPDAQLKKFYATGLDAMSAKGRESMLNDVKQDPKYAHIFTEENMKKIQETTDKIKTEMIDRDPRVANPNDLQSLISDTTDKVQKAQAIQESSSMKNIGKTARFASAATGGLSTTTANKFEHDGL